jgi:hypothetical protein
MEINDDFLKIFACVEQILITLLQENRYSWQLIRSIETLSEEMNVSPDIMDKSIYSLSTIDEYLNRLEDKTDIPLEIHLSITIYFSQVLIIHCYGSWDTSRYVLPSSSPPFYSSIIYSLLLNKYNSCFSFLPHYDVMDNLSKSTSDLKGIVENYITQIDNGNIKEGRHPLRELDTLIIEGQDFFLEIIPLQISKLAQTFNIPSKSLNRSVSSVKLIQEVIRTSGYDLNIILEREDYFESLIRFDDKVFFALIVYLGEVIIKAVDGEWRVSAEKTYLGECPQYRWMIRIFNSQNKELFHFIDHALQGLWDDTYERCRFHRLIQSYIKEQNHVTVWCESTEIETYPTERIWKDKLEKLGEHATLSNYY